MAFKNTLLPYSSAILRISQVAMFLGFKNARPGEAIDCLNSDIPGHALTVSIGRGHHQNLLHPHSERGRAMNKKNIVEGHIPIIHAFVFPVDANGDRFYHIL